ncbi:hypothetical protein J7M02_06810, partial [Candidatus Aerophobetes bacterium]|nr:hypothetical protein [Candidatus Aerophobetes bacterium]
MRNGWIKLHRKIRDNEIWKEKPFDKRSAWIDLLLRANHKDNEILIGNTPVKIKAGQVLTSQVQLANDWGWSRYKVQCFLKLLEKLKQITIENKALKKAQRYTLLTIINWELYQTTNEKKSTKKSSKKAVKKQSKSTNKNVKNDKECKEINNDIYGLFDYWNSLEIIVHKDITKFKPHLRAALQVYSVEEIKEAMRNYSEIIKG